MTALYPRKSDGLAPGTKVWRWRGQDYYGAADLAACVPCDIRTVYKHQRKYGNLDRLGAQVLKDGSGRAGNPRIVPVALEVDGVTYEWPSIRQTALALGWKTSSAQRCYQSTGRGRAKLVAAVAAWSKEKDKWNTPD